MEQLDYEEQNKVSHYVWIKDFNTLMNTQSKNHNQKFFCKYCIQHFTEERIFKDHTDAPFVIYADFEAIVEPSNKAFENSSYQNHIACGYGYKLVCNYDDKYSKPAKVYREMVIIPEQKQEFKKSKVCHICKRKYSDSDYIFNKPVRDGCHALGLYRGSAHNNCNRLYRLTNKISVVFHNLRGYDSHFIMQEIGKIIRKNEEKN
ncbi:hypothetical protein MAR_007044 [Mya arenaria]|uniref:DNA-directed DNA polymerase n=1 Tax=Mya arenaria TaxID=6604 RepID=A0ABY7DER9_MYAAR|nr:hypothetical protein MAR_007044 [Mya arenaria]